MSVSSYPNIGFGGIKSSAAVLETEKLISGNKPFCTFEEECKVILKRGIDNLKNQNYQKEWEQKLEVVTLLGNQCFKAKPIFTPLELSDLNDLKLRLLFAILEPPQTSATRKRKITQY